MGWGEAGAGCLLLQAGTSPSGTSGLTILHLAMNAASCLSPTACLTSLPSLSPSGFPSVSEDGLRRSPSAQGCRCQGQAATLHGGGIQDGQGPLGDPGASNGASLLSNIT